MASIIRQRKREIMQRIKHYSVKAVKMRIWGFLEEEKKNLIWPLILVQPVLVRFSLGPFDFEVKQITWYVKFHILKAMDKVIRFQSIVSVFMCNWRKVLCMYHMEQNKQEKNRTSYFGEDRRWCDNITKILGHIRLKKHLRSDLEGRRRG